MGRELRNFLYLPTTAPIRDWSCILAHAQRLGGISPSCGAILDVSVASLGLFMHIVMQGFTPMNHILPTQLTHRHENAQCKMLWVLLATTHHPPDTPSLFLDSTSADGACTTQDIDNQVSLRERQLSACTLHKEAPIAQRKGTQVTWVDIGATLCVLLHSTWV